MSRTFDKQDLPQDDDGVLVKVIGDNLRDRLIEAMTAAGSKVNADPLLIVEAQETAAERLARYLDHVVLNRAARRLIDSLGAQEV